MDLIPYTGKLDTMVEIFRLDMVPNASGENIPTPVKIVGTYAAMATQVGNTRMEEKLEHVVNTTFIIRRRQGVIANKELWLEALGIKYRIIHVEALKRSHLKIHCTAYE